MQMMKIPFNYGTLAGLVLFLIFLGLYALGMHPLIVGPVFFFPVPILAVVFTLLRVKNTMLGGKITFRRAFYTGVVESFVSVSFFCIMAYIYITLFAHSFIDDYFKNLELFMGGDKGAPFNLGGLVDIEEMKKSLNPWTATQGWFFNGFFYSTVVSLIVALIVKNQKWSPGVEDSRNEP